MTPFLGAVSVHLNLGLHYTPFLQSVTRSSYSRNTTRVRHQLCIIALSVT